MASQNSHPLQISSLDSNCSGVARENPDFAQPVTDEASDPAIWGRVGLFARASFCARAAASVFRAPLMHIVQKGSTDILL